MSSVNDSQLAYLPTFIIIDNNKQFFALSYREDAVWGMSLLTDDPIDFN